MAIGDFANLTDVKAWLNTAATTDDAMLARLISTASRFILAETGRRGFVVRSVTDTLSGNGKSTFYLRQYPVLSVTTLTVNGPTNIIAAQQPSSAPYGTGYTLEAWDGSDACTRQQIWIAGASVAMRGFNNIVCTYLAGYRATENYTVASPYTYQPLRPWASDQGVINTGTGIALTVVSGTPAAGQYSVSVSGLYTFAAADTGHALAVTYGYTPDSLQAACIELVGERYRTRERIGMTSKTLGGQETTAFSQRDMNAFICDLIQPFKDVTLL